MSIFRLFATVILFCSLSSSLCLAEGGHRPAISLHQDVTQKGWDYLSHKLLNAGIKEHEILSVYRNKQMPPFDKVPFRLDPKESRSMYREFLSDRRTAIARSFLVRNEVLLSQAEERFKVSRYLITSILFIETQFGKVTGRELVINRLSRLASIGEPKNVAYNFERLSKEDPTVTFEQVQARARYLEETFFPELPALFEIARRNQINPLSIRGSSAGAFGIPQFLPTTYLKFGIDADGDSKVSLFSEPDAIWSTANFFASAGWRDNLPPKEKEAIIWQYNRSAAYVETVLAVADLISRK